MRIKTYRLFSASTLSIQSVGNERLIYGRLSKPKLKHSEKGFDVMLMRRVPPGQLEQPIRCQQS